VQVLDATAQKVYCARVVLVRDSSLSSKRYGLHPLNLFSETPQLARLRIIWIQNHRKSAISKFESVQLREKDKSMNYPLSKVCSLKLC